MIIIKLKNIGLKNKCLNFRHLFSGFLMCLSLGAGADEVQSKHISRKPAAIEEEVLTVPLAESTFFTNENMFAEDDSGVMKEMKASLSAWEKTEEFVKQWDLQSTGVYKIPTASEKGKYISKKMLRYVDKRLSGEMRNAREGSTLHSMKNVEKNLRPNAHVNISKNFGLKFRARVLQGKATVEVKNPWIHCSATVAANGRMVVNTKKEFKEIGLTSGADYFVNDSKLTTYIDQQLTGAIKARVSNTGGNDADSRVEMMASFPFNF